MQSSPVRSWRRSRRAAGVCSALAAVALFAPAFVTPQLHAQQPVATAYRDHARLGRALDSLQRAHPRLVQVSTIGNSAGGRALQAIRLGAGGDAADQRPALLVVANAYGPQLVGSEIAIAAAGRLAASYGRDSATTRLLDGNTIYLIPRANPDAAEAFFRAPLMERIGNDTKTDDDRDGMLDEDGPEDLNGDGLITMMRVADPDGAWMADAMDPLIMRRANAARGERGGWQFHTEGRDSDGDGQVNEDGPGGTDVNRNFTHDYQFFAEGMGLYPMSSTEARALADYLIDHPNIAAAYVLGPQDNLVKPWEFRRTTGIAGNPTGTSAGGPLQSILQPDEAWFAELSRRYRKATGQTKAPASAPLEGDVLSWLYYDMGRLAFGSPGWVMPDAPTDSARATPRPEQPDPSADERASLRWLRTNAPASVVEWTRVEHPDFPGKVVEVGGFRPYALQNPPASMLDDVLARQTTFIGELAASLPRVALREIRVESVGDRTFRITAQIVNEGYFPTQAAIGARVRWPRAVRVDLKTSDSQHLAAGRAVQLMSPIAGSGRSTELSWLVVGAPGSTVTLEAASPTSGRATETITLRAR